MQTSEKVLLGLGVAVVVWWLWPRTAAAAALPTPAPTPPLPPPPAPQASSAGIRLGGPKSYTVVTQNTGAAGALLVRAGPGLSYAQVASLPHGSTAQATGRIAQSTTGSGWAEMAVQGQAIGWSSLDYLKPTLPVVSVVQEAAPTWNTQYSAWYLPIHEVYADGTYSRTSEYIQQPTQLPKPPAALWVATVVKDYRISPSTIQVTG